MLIWCPVHVFALSAGTNRWPRLLLRAHAPQIERRNAAISCIISVMSETRARILRRESESDACNQPFEADRCLPASVRGPVDRSHGFLARHCRRSRSRSSIVHGRRLEPLILPAVTRAWDFPAGRDATATMVVLLTLNTGRVISQFGSARKRNIRPSGR